MLHKTKDGALIRMIREKDSSDLGRERGWITHSVIAYNGGDNLGKLSFTWIPDFKKRYAEIELYCKAFGRRDRAKDDHRTSQEFHGEPYVAGVHVEEVHRRRHVAIALYRESALWLAQDWGLRLRSGDPSSDAEAVWRKMIDLGEPVVEVSIFKYGKRMALDYRDCVQ